MVYTNKNLSSHNLFKLDSISPMNLNDRLLCNREYCGTANGNRIDLLDGCNEIVGTKVGMSRVGVDGLSFSFSLASIATTK